MNTYNHYLVVVSKNGIEFSSEIVSVDIEKTLGGLDSFQCQLWHDMPVINNILEDDPELYISRIERIK